MSKRDDFTDRFPFIDESTTLHQSSSASCKFNAYTALAVVHSVHADWLRFDTLSLLPQGMDLQGRLGGGASRKRGVHTAF